MAPLPDNATARAFIEYTSLGQEHVMLVRFLGGGFADRALQFYDAATTALREQMLRSDAFTGLRLSQAGSAVSYPVAVATVPGTIDSSGDPAQAPNFVSWTGRTIGGRRTRVTFFTPVVQEPARYRIAPVPAGAYRVFLGLLEDPGFEVVAVDGLIPIWNDYLNVGINAYYQREARRS